MNGLVFIAALCLATGALAVERNSCQCKDPCDDCDAFPTCNKTYTPFCDQQIEEELVLTCTPWSYCKSLTYKGCYTWPTGCTGIQTIEAATANGLLYVCNTWDGRSEELRAEARGNYRAQVSWLDGNWIRNEWAKLDDCKCEDNILRSSVTYIVTDGPDTKVPALDACCKGGAQDLVAVNYDVSIYGEGCRKNCCSQCSLHYANVHYPKHVTNTRA